MKYARRSSQLVRTGPKEQILFTLYRGGGVSRQARD